MKQTVVFLVLAAVSALVAFLLFEVDLQTSTGEPSPFGIILILRGLGCLATLAALLNLYAAFHKSIWLYFRTRQIPKYLRDSSCLRCGSHKGFCMCKEKYCPKCGRVTKHNPVDRNLQVDASSLPAKVRLWRCYDCIHVHDAAPSDAADGLQSERAASCSGGTSEMRRKLSALAFDFIVGGLMISGSAGVLYFLENGFSSGGPHKSSALGVPYWPIIGIVAAAWVLWTCLMWWLDFRVYGRSYGHAFRLSVGLLARSGRGVHAAIYVIAFVVVIVLLCASSRYNHTLLVAAAVTCICRPLAMARPPGMLLLASSRSWNYKLITSALQPRTLHPIRYLLRDSADGPASRSVVESHIEHEVDVRSNRHILSDEDWETTVFGLMEAVPAIIVDATFLNGALAHELRRILENERLRAKTLVLISDGPFHEQNTRWRIDISRFVVCEGLGELGAKASALLRHARRTAR